MSSELMVGNRRGVRITQASGLETKCTSSVVLTVSKVHSARCGPSTCQKWDHCLLTEMKVHSIGMKSCVKVLTNQVGD